MLAFLLFVNACGFIIVFHRLRYSAKIEMKEKIRNEGYLDDEVVNIRIRKENLYKNTDRISWEDEKEFRMNNNLYDIIEVVPCVDDPGCLEIHALNDSKEEHILKTFAGRIDQLVNEKLNTPNIKTILFALISQALPYKYFSLADVNPGFIIIKNYESSALKNYISPTEPPPKYM